MLGSGPAGFYAAQALLKRFPDIHIDLLEHLPVPFGLVRYGVAPDHPSTKNVISGFSQFIENNRRHIRFLGNIPTLSAQGLSLNELNELYDITVLATGASNPRTLPNVDLPPTGAYSAHDLIFWLNSHPAAHAKESVVSMSSIPTMSNIIADARNVDVVGLGNVAVDVARLLLRPVEDLRATDISPKALDILEKAEINTVSLIGRRSPRHASWTTAALREVVTKIPGIITRCDHALVHRDAAMDSVPQATKRTLKLLAEKTIDLDRGFDDVGYEKQLRLEFLLEPESISRHGSITELNLVENEMLPSATGIRSGVRRTGRTFCKLSDVVFLSLGYAGGSGYGIRVGWANGSGKGIIGDSKWDAETVIQQLPDIELMNGQRNVSTKCGVDRWLRKNNWESVTWDGWKQIDEEERKRGTAFGYGRERVKIESFEEMMQVARGTSPVIPVSYQ